MKGQPRTFVTEDIFKHKFNDYIDKCIAEEKLANIAGFCVFCDMTRETFYAQQNYYSDTYKKVQEILEDYTINAKINDTFKIFYMKNKFNYRDKTEIDNNIKLDKSPVDELVESINNLKNEDK